MTYLVVSVLVLCDNPAASEDPATALATLLRHAPIVVLGETHHKPESPQLMVETVTTYLQGGGGCLTIGLEISSDEQPMIESVMQGTQPLSTISIPPLIDHPAYRAMLASFRELMHAGQCVTVRAIDAPQTTDDTRDAWMARQLAQMKSDWPVLVFVGNLHTLKQVRWQRGQDNPFLAERLVRRGIPVVSVLQNWERDCVERVGQLFPIQHPRATTALHAIVRVAAVSPPAVPAAVADYAVVWQCRPPDQDTAFPRQAEGD